MNQWIKIIPDRFRNLWIISDVYFYLKCDANMMHIGVNMTKQKYCKEDGKSKDEIDMTNKKHLFIILIALLILTISSIYFGLSTFFQTIFLRVFLRNFTGVTYPSEE